ncbi:MAG TPA: cyclic nucleotide-binding domain-containing protein [Mycobacteriales bacterium]|jgi:CRP-like cAMP-binding protein|nr:cyclic nucleotide-binding domain-containing protein [Mycobacteriales bacterium]
MARNNRADLRKLPVFAGLSKRALARVDALLTPVAFSDGDVLCQEGKLGREAFVIVSGEVEVSRGADHLATLGQGSVVGEMALLGHGPRTATVTAAGDVEALVMSAQEFASVLAEPEVAHEVQRVAAQRSGVLAAA